MDHQSEPFPGAWRRLGLSGSGNQKIRISEYQQIKRCGDKMVEKRTKQRRIIGTMLTARVRGKGLLKAILVILIIGICAALAGWIIYTRKAQRDSNVLDSLNKQDTPLKVIAEPIGTSNISETISVTGTFEALASVEIIPEITGRLEKLRLPNGTFIDVGTSVQADEIIAVIEHSALVAAAQQAEAALVTAKASSETARVILVDAEREKKRMEGLLGSGAIPEQQYDAACTAYDRAKAGLELAKANVKQAEAALANAKITLDKATIEAPITAVVSDRYVDEGDMVGPTTALIKIVDIKTLKVLGGVGERYLPQLVPGETAVHIKTDAYPQDVFEGTVFRIGVAIDPATRTGQVEIRVPNSNMRLKPGMFARMTIVLQERENVVVVPDSALIREQDKVYVFVANAGKAHRREVKLGLLQSEYYEVLEGLSEGELVVTRGRKQIEDGQAIEVIQEMRK
jgi:RND family efflux transporter MFP subunit